MVAFASGFPRRVTRRRPGPRVVDLFSGAGLFAGAFASKGFELVDAVELNSIAAATHARNLGSAIRVGDVTELHPTCKCEVLIAGPPCQGFSSLGKMDANDPRNLLALDLLRWVKSCEPQIVVIENVPQFLLSSAWKTLASRFERLGYEIGTQVLNAVDYQVAQYRSRSFTFASRVGLPNIQARHARRPLTVRDALNGLSPVPNGVNAHDTQVPTVPCLERIRAIPPGGDKRDLMRVAPHLAVPSWWATPQEATDVWGRMHWDRPSNTLRTGFLHPSKGRYIHPDQDRVISLREAARIHSIPDDWMFEGTPYQIARQIGNSVPFNLGRFIAGRVKDLL